jgi:hypothetical protein
MCSTHEQPRVRKVTKDVAPCGTLASWNLKSTRKYHSKDNSDKTLCEMLSAAAAGNPLKWRPSESVRSPCWRWYSYSRTAVLRKSESGCSGETDRCVKVALRLGYAHMCSRESLEAEAHLLVAQDIGPGMGALDRLWCSCRSRQRAVSMPCASGSAGTYSTITTRRSIFQVWISRLPLSYTCVRRRSSTCRDPLPRVLLQKEKPAVFPVQA